MSDLPDPTYGAEVAGEKRLPPVAGSLSAHTRIRPETVAWNSRNPASVAALYREDGPLRGNDAEPAGGPKAIADVALGYESPFIYERSHLPAA